MPQIGLKVVGLQNQTLEAFNVTGAYQAFYYIGQKNPTGSAQPYTMYKLRFSNIDGKVGPTTAAEAMNSTASFWYSPVDLCATGSGARQTSSPGAST